MMKTIGLIGGTTWLSTIDYYRIIGIRHFRLYRNPAADQARRLHDLGFRYNADSRQSRRQVRIGLMRNCWLMLKSN